MESLRTKYITKSIYLDYLACGKNAWLKLHKQELQSFFNPSDFDKSLMGQGQIVEQLAQQLFPRGVTVSHLNTSDAINSTQFHMARKTSVLFQATFVTGDFLIRCDILEYCADIHAWNLYEIKASNGLEERLKETDHIEDISMQTIVLRQQGLKVAKTSLIYLNKQYKLSGAINIHELFILEDVTDQVQNRIEKTTDKMQNAQACLLQNNEQEQYCNCIYRGRSAHCETFQYSYPSVPKYSVHDIARIGSSPKKLNALVEQQIFDMQDIPNDFELSEIQKKQVELYQSKAISVKNELIKEALSSLSFPLYFLDYETYPSAIPLFNGYRPYQQITFQFSLHVAKDSHSQPVHFEYLHEQQSDPSLILIQKLLATVGSKGNIIVWNKSFETKQNNELAQLHPEYAEFLYDINNRMYDLMDIFAKQMYVHHAFNGKTSLKNVLPVLVPELSYEGLAIQNGGAASKQWADMFSGNLTIEERQEIAINLKKYCGLDTFAMYKIWQFLHEHISSK